MKSNKRIPMLMVLLLTSQMISLILCWKSLMKRIPNANRVPDPCDTALVWEGVGHLKPGGWGARNQFGIDFKKHSLTWTKEFCNLDSDQDGRTNGKELGDPRCEWTPANNHSLMFADVTHPGICEPIESPHCKEANKWFWCEDRNFTCDAINEPATKNVTVKFPRLEVPKNETTHYCMIFDFPQDGDFHIIASKPALDNTKVMHHILVYGCKDDVNIEHSVNQPYECPLPFDRACRDLIAVWLLGSNGHCANRNAGFRIGTNGYKRGGIQIHWENPELLEGEKDGSGMTFYYTAKTDRQDSGILSVGQDYMVIPPGEVTHTETSVCTSDCTRRKFSQDIHVTFGFNHMHYLGKAMKIEHIRNGEVINVITDDPHFMYDSPVLFTHKEPIVIKPSDEIRTTCIFDSTTRNITTRAGSGYFTEMCYGFLTFYPKQAITSGNPTCTAWKNIPACHFELDNTIDGCDFKNVHNLSHPQTKAYFDKVIKHCRPFGPCYKDCLAIIQDLKLLPCFRGDIWEWSRDTIVTKQMNDSIRNEWFKFYAGYDSCANLKIENSFQDNFSNSAIANMNLNMFLFIFVVFFL